MRPYIENRYLKVVRDTVGLNSYLRLSPLSKNFFFGLHININMGRLFPQTFWTHSENPLEHYFPATMLVHIWYAPT